MDARFYNSEEIDIERLASDLTNIYLTQGYQAQQIGTNNQTLVQLKKGGDFEAILGMQAALSLTLQKTKGGVLAMIGQQRWIDKAAVGAVGIVALPVLWPLALTAGVGALRQASLGNQVLNVVDGLVRQQVPAAQVGPVPSYLVPQVQQQWNAPSAQAPYYTPPPQTPPAYVPPQPVVPNYAPPQSSAPPPAPAPAQLRCPQCNTPYEPGDTFCSGCGRALSTPKMYCSNCNTEIKAGASFCPRCGASTFHTLSATGQNIPAPAPAPASQAPVYTAPKPPAPVYTPPPTPVYTPPKQPPTPAYVPPTPQTPASPPQPTVYYTPSPSAQTPASTSATSTGATASPQPATPAPQKQPEPYYIPPATQEPAVVPQPKVTIVPSTPKQEPPPPKPRPQKQYYTPPTHTQPTIPATPAVAGTPQYEALSDQATQSVETAKQLSARPVTSPTTSDPDLVWGTLIFSDGQEAELKGERAVIGRYDHDLGGIEPDVDLSKMNGSDTVSRVHAALEHIGSAFMLTDLNSTNATRINGKRLDPDLATPISDGDTLQFGKITSTFKKA